MERCLTWYSLWLKVYLKRKTGWIQLVGMVLLLLLMNSISLPDGDNVSVGIYCGGGECAKELVGRLVEDDTLYKFKEYDSREELEKAVVSGKLECGFLLDSELDEKIKKGDLRKSIVYMTTPLSTKGMVIRETVYSTLFQIYSDEILKKNEADIFGAADAERTEQLIEYNHLYQQSSAIFQLEIKEIDVGAKELQDSLDGVTYPVQGMVGLFIFLIIFLANGRRFDSRGTAVEKALGRWDRFVFGCMSHLAAGTMPAITGMLLILSLAETDNVLKEMVGLALFVCISSVWVMVVGSFLKKNTTFVSTILSIVTANMLICPIFINLETYLPAVSYVRMIFPLGIYLNWLM